MGGTNSKIRLKIGQMDVKFEGSEEFIKEHLAGLVAKVVDQYADHKAEIPDSPTTVADGQQPAATDYADLTTNTIATLSDAKSGGDLVMAAAAFLTIAKGKERMMRSDLLVEMKSAVSFYKETYNKNLTATLNSLAKADRLRVIGKDTYAMSTVERQAQEEILAAG